MNLYKIVILKICLNHRGLTSSHKWAPNTMMSHSYISTSYLKMFYEYCPIILWCQIKYVEGVLRFSFFRPILEISSQSIGSTLENCRIQDVLITINSCFQGRAPSSIMNLIKNRDHKYNLRGNNVLSLAKVNSTKHGLNSFK